MIMRSHKLGTKYCFIAAEALQAMPRVKDISSSKTIAQAIGTAVTCANGFCGFYMQEDMRIHVVSRQSRPNSVSLAMEKCKSIIQDHACSCSTLMPED